MSALTRVNKLPIGFLINPDIIIPSPPATAAMEKLDSHELKKQFPKKSVKPKHLKN